MKTFMKVWKVDLKYKMQNSGKLKLLSAACTVLIHVTIIF